MGHCRSRGGAPHLPGSGSVGRAAAPSVVFFQYLGACRRRTPRTRVGLKGPQDVSHRDLSDATLRFDLTIGVRRRHAPKKLLKIDPRSGADTTEEPFERALRISRAPFFFHSRSMPTANAEAACGRSGMAHPKGRPPSSRPTFRNSVVAPRRRHAPEIFREKKNKRKRAPVSVAAWKRCCVEPAP